ncbi:serine hydrolase domain-containing protein [Deinococcus yunweiensis]|uniref:serine hydrolase domain-containing protein n=1 Tax=Deinococcus yunweiensis TaxID=367282 RepID=UPI00398F3B8A
MQLTERGRSPAALLGLAVVSCAAAAPFPGATMAQIDAIVRETMREQNLPGVVVGVWIPGQGEYEAAYGVADLRTGRARQVGDAFRIASISKTFTATAILQLADQGRLSTGDLLSRWFPDFPNAGRITVRDLLTMRSGVAEFADTGVLEAYYRRPLAPFTAQDAIRLAAAKAASFSAPDAQTVYTNTNYVLLEQIVERVSEQDMNAYLQEHVLAPLGLRHTFYPTGPLLPSRLHGYSWDAGTGIFRDLTWLNPQLAGGAGAVVSTLGDLHTYVRALCTGTLLQPATQAGRLAGQPGAGGPAFIRYGEGVLLSGPFCGHNGTIFGFSTEAFYLPARDAVIVINVNRLDQDDRSQSSALFLRLTKALFPQDVPW